MEIQLYLDSVDFDNRLTKKISDKFEDELTLEECTKALNEMKFRKSP